MNDLLKKLVMMRKQFFMLKVLYTECNEDHTLDVSRRFWRSTQFFLFEVRLQKIILLPQSLAYTCFHLASGQNDRVEVKGPGIVTGDRGKKMRKGNQNLPFPHLAIRKTFLLS